MYNENEYFLKFLAIHPFLTYSKKLLDNKKKEYQLFLLDQFNKEIINYDELQTNYNKIIDIENNNKQNLEDIKYKHKQIEKYIENNNNNNLIQLFDYAINNKE
jgi:hypothetical protein